TLDRWAAVERHLPGYPPILFELVRRELSLPTHPAVVDVGCGTGRASLAMARLGWRVTAVDPDEAALEVLRARADAEALEITALSVTAEATHLDSASVDVVTAAHAFHWFDGPAALAEMTRIIRPGGGVALFWNVREPARSPFLAAYHDLLDRYRVEKGLYVEASRASRAAGRALRRAPGLGAPVRHEVRNELVRRPADFVEMAFRASFIRAFKTEVQAKFRADLTELLDLYGYTGRATFIIPNRIDCWIARRTRHNNRGDRDHGRGPATRAPAAPPLTPPETSKPILEPLTVSGRQRAQPAQPAVSITEA
ncbi:MAG: class I SAM-dependent methyltransferase, partial [Candidatus Limnocylindria bacterium]